ncbi:cytochrome c biogenesis protein ResB [Bdellovibrio sp. HCB209]|uniref:cytochrome c biogenesis protein ResB n=1 Tax=Bdellovibrio sp. HCB209 TaxID=3394354 RepID=UPI0039B56710
MSWFRKVVKTLASLRLAVVIISTIAVLIAVGTVVESKYDAWTAKNLVYSSVWMYSAMGALALSLIAVIADRWPWKPKHVAFISAHIGIIFILFGSILTQVHGIDGTINLPRDRSAVKEVTVQDTELTVYRSFDGADYEKVYSEEVNFIKKPVSPEKPYVVKSKGLDFEILESIPYSLAKQIVEPSPHTQSGAGLRFQLSNANVSEIGWMIQRNVFEKVEKQIGPVLVSLGGLWDRNTEIHEIRLNIKDDGKLAYALYRKGEAKPQKEGVTFEGDHIQTGWMGLELKVLRYLPKAVQKFDIERMDHPTPNTSPSLHVKYNGQESYLFLNDYIKVFTQDRVYLIAYQNRRIPLGFEMNLNDFKKTDYPGTMRAMAYQSVVNYDGGKETLISMNEPLKYKGFYFYQASFNQSASGLITSSVLSVNSDPGRIWKYAGSLIMCIGIVLLFFFRHRYRKNLKPM